MSAFPRYNRVSRRQLFAGAAIAGVLASFARILPARAALPTPKPVRVSGELVDTWCNVSGLMYGLGTAHHQCAIWCALGGIPVSIRDKDGNFYLILKVEADTENAANPRMARIQTHEVVVDGDLIVQDGVNYLLISKVADDKGIINMTQDEYGIQPFGN